MAHVAHTLRRKNRGGQAVWIAWVEQERAGSAAMFSIRARGPGPGG